MQKNRILIFGSGYLGHNNAICLHSASFVNRNYEIDFVITENFKEALAKYPCNFIYYPSEVLEIYLSTIQKLMEKKVMEEEKNVIFLTSQIVFDLHSCLCSIIVPWALRTFNPDNYKFVIYDSMSLWSNCLAVHWKLPEICSLSFFKYPRFLFDKIEDENSKKLIESFNKEYGTNWNTVVDIIAVDNAKKMIMYTSEYFHFYNDSLPKEKILFSPRSNDAIFFKGRKKIEPGSLIYFSLGTLFNTNPNVYRIAMHTLGRFKQYRVLFSFGKTLNLYNEIKKENVYDNIEMVEWADQKKVLLECSLFITHGGMNGVREAIQCATPMIVCPQFADQPYTAKRIFELKAGLVIEKHDMKEENLEKAILQIESNYDSFFDGAQKIQESFLNSMDGDELVTAIEEYIELHKTQQN